MCCEPFTGYCNNRIIFHMFYFPSKHTDFTLVRSLKQVKNLAPTYKYANPQICRPLQDLALREHVRNPTVSNLLMTESILTFPVSRHRLKDSVFG